MKTYSQSILPELEGWEERLVLALRNVEANRTIGKPRYPGGPNRKNALITRSLEELQADFWFRVKVSTPNRCWHWQLSDGTTAKTYGEYRWINGEKMKAHRISSMMRYGVFTDPGWCACHHCDTPSCCNPRHLFIGTRLDNTKDMMAKGRRRAGKPKTKLSEEEVSYIRKLGPFQKPGWAREIAECFGVTKQTVNSILRGNGWASVKVN